MGKPYNSLFDQSLKMNKWAYNLYYLRLLELSISMFDWKNLPDTVDARYMELMLFQDGQVVFFKDEVMGELALQVAGNGKYDIYGIPRKRRAYGNNGYQNPTLNEDNSVIIFNNMLHTNSMLPVMDYAEKLYDLDQTIIINAKAQKTPILITCDEKERLTLKNVYMQYDGNQPFIFGNKALDPKSLQVLKTDAPLVTDKLYQLKTQIWNEALTYLGISNTNTQKKERMLTDEVIRNMGGTIASRYSRLNERRTACDKINKMFGLNIECNFREDYREADDEVMFEGETGENGKMRDMAIDLRTN
jgi:hypothetical protein